MTPMHKLINDQTKSLGRGYLIPRISKAKATYKLTTPPTERESPLTSAPGKRLHKESPPFMRAIARLSNQPNPTCTLDQGRNDSNRKGTERQTMTNVSGTTHKLTSNA